MKNQNTLYTGWVFSTNIAAIRVSEIKYEIWSIRHHGGRDVFSKEYKRSYRIIKSLTCVLIGSWKKKYILHHRVKFLSREKVSQRKFNILSSFFTSSKSQVPKYKKKQRLFEKRRGFTSFSCSNWLSGSVYFPCVLKIYSQFKCKDFFTSQKEY